MRSLLVPVYFAVIIGYIGYTTYFPEHTTVARAISFGLLVSGAILNKIHPRKSNDPPAPEPIHPLNLSQGESPADPRNSAR